MRVAVYFRESVYQLLGQMAEREGKTMAEVLRDSIAPLKWYEDEKAKGHRILVERKGVVRELLP